VACEEVYSFSCAKNNHLRTGADKGHEVVDAIDHGTPEMLREELGDLLLQVVFQASLTEQKGWW